MTEPGFLRATRVAHDTVAIDFAELLRTPKLGRTSMDCVMLGAFAELVQARARRRSRLWPGSRERTAALARDRGSVDSAWQDHHRFAITSEMWNGR